MATEKMIIDIEVDTRGLKTSLGKAESVVSKSARKINKLFLSIGAVFSTGAIISGINNTIKSLDSLNKTASKLGTTTEQLSSLGFAAERAGIQTSTFEMAMQRMTRRAAEAAQGTGEAQKAIKELGIDAVKFSNLSLEEKMYQLSDALQGVGNESDQLRIAFKLFDSEGAALVNMLKNGSDELKQFQRVSDETGNTVETKLANSASIAADSLSNFNAALSGMVNNITAAFLPALNKAFFALLDFFDIPRQKSLDELTIQQKGLTDELERMQNILNNPSAFDKFFNADVTSAKLLHTKQALADVERQIASIQNQTASQPLFSEGFTASAAAFQLSLDKLLTTLLPVETQIKKYYESVGFLNSALDKGAITQEQFSKAMQNLNASMPQVNTGMKELTDQVEVLIDAVGSKLENAFMSTFRNLMDGTLNLKETMVSLIKDIIAELIRLLVVKQAVGGIMGSLGVSTASVDGAFASGGTVMSTGNYLVGEKGPEIVSLPAGANVTANKDIGTSVNVNVQNYGNDQVDVRQNGNDVDIIIKKISNDITRGTGTVGPALEARYGLAKA